MTEHEMHKREGLTWLAAQLRWEDRLAELRGATAAPVAAATDPTAAEPAPIAA